VKKSFPQAKLGRCVTVYRRKHLAHTAAISWELKIQLAQNPAQVRGLVYQKNMVIHFSQVEGRPDSADACADDQG
jgi:hypothetical protein